MAQIAEDEVKKALNEAAALEEPDAGLRPEDVERIKAAYAEPDPEARASRIAALLSELEAAALGNEQRLVTLQGGFGLAPGMTSSFIAGDRLDSAARGEIEQAIEAATAKALETARREARQALSGPKTARPPRVGRIKI